VENKVGWQTYPSLYDFFWSLGFSMVALKMKSLLSQ